MQSFAIIMCMQLIAKHYHSKSQQSGAVVYRKLFCDLPRLQQMEMAA